MIADTFIKRPVTAMVIAIVITILGIITIFTLPVSQYPDITPPVVTVSGNYTGADALTVEQTVTTPVETQVNGTPGMAYMQSNSSNTGSMSLNVTFDLGTDVNIAALDVQNRVNIASPELPEAVTRLGLTVLKRNPSILMVVSLYSPNNTHNIRFLDNYANIYLKDEILRVNGVGDVFALGSEFSMRIWLNPDKLARMNLTPAQIIGAVQEQNVQVAAGIVGAPPQPSWQAFEYTAFLSGRLKTAEEFGNIVIRTDPETGSLVYLKDVARLELGKFSYSGNTYVDGRRASFLLIFQTPESNALETANGVYKKLDQLSKTFPVDVSYNVPFETVSVIRQSIKEVVKTLFETLMLVILVVFLFIENWRATLIPILAIPVSIIGTFIFFLPLGFTINKLTLFGFVLAIGIVVDDAIIVVEAAQRYIDEKHLPAKEAIQHAMNDISGPIVAIALVLASVFVPVGFIPGIVGKLYQQFAITIAISVLISAYIALSLTPALCSLFLRPRHLSSESAGINRFFFRFDKWFKQVTKKYTEGVQKSILHSGLVGLFLAVIIGITVFLVLREPTSFIPTEDEGRVYITFQLPEASSTSRTEEVLVRIMDILKDIKGVGHYAGVAGLNVINFSRESNSGTIFCQFLPWKQRRSKSLHLDALVTEMERRFSVIKEANVLVIKPPAIPGIGATGGFTFELQERESSDNIQQFNAVVINFMIAANQRPEIARAFTFFTSHTPGYQFNIDRLKCKKLGVKLTDVFNTLQTYLASFYINDFTAFGRNFRVVAQADTAYRDDVRVLDNYYVPNGQGDLIPLSSLINYHVTESAPLITHYNLYRSAEFNGNSAPGYSSGEAIQALQEVAGQVLPIGYGYEFSGLSREEIRAGKRTFFVFVLSVLFVFLFLAALYESWITPFSILLAVPLAGFGAIVALTFSSVLNNNVYAQIGLITLIGLAAKNSILIVQFAKERVDSGMPLVKSTLQAVRLRLRPILMTSLAFTFGVLPLAFAGGAGEISRRTIGWTVLGGMLGATFLGIFIVPVLYVIITRITQKITKKTGTKESPGNLSAQ